MVDPGGGAMSGFEHVCALFEIDDVPRFIPIIRARLAWEWVDSLRRHDPSEIDRLLRQMVHEYAVFVGDEPPTQP